VIPGEGEIHAWIASLDVSAGALDGFRAALSTDELARAARFHFDRDRAHFTAARGMLRRLLADYLETAPAGLSFVYGEHGKPALAAPWDATGLRFNLSHSHGYALYACTTGREIGCDIEQFRDDVLGDRIADRFFSPAENADLNALPAEARTQGFFNCWTRKEAWIKARSHGLSLPLDSFDVTLAPGEPARLLATRPDAGEAARWSLIALDAPPGFAAAIAVQGTPGRVAVRTFTGY
jgi:4'-phosphopantetheinyl transferase